MIHKVYTFSQKCTDKSLYKIVNRLRETIATVFSIFAYPFN